ncbi:hypothetical protein HY637_03440 [Candidatus Woesearchaeota archaeon]|nr:hypothetical protein [Candidatus Woesearchaeota archaeon]
MVFSKRTLEDMVNESGPISIREVDEICELDLLIRYPPEDLSKVEGSLSQLRKVISNSIWMYDLHHVAGFIFRSGASFNDVKKFLYGSSVKRSPVFLALENAFYRGTKVPFIHPVTIRYFSGGSGVIVQVNDHAAGFNFEEVLRKVGSGERYFKREGHGFRTYGMDHLEVSFQNNGAIVNIMYKWAFPARSIEKREPSQQVS